MKQVLTAVVLLAVFAVAGVAVHLLVSGAIGVIER